MRGTVLVALSGFCIAALPGAGIAQIVEPLTPIPPLPVGPEAPQVPGQPAVIGKTVTDRARPEVDPLGVRAGEFFIFPRLEVDEGYNDNLFATPANKQSAWLTQLMPSFDILSNFSQNALYMSGGAALGRYSSHTSENFDDAFGLVGGRYDLSALTNVFASARFDRLHEPRTAPTSPGAAAEPVKYSTYNGTVGIAQTGTRIGYEVDGAVTRSEYEAPPATGGGFIAQDDRNVTGYEGAVRLSYEFFPDYQAFVRGSGNSQQYDHAAGNGISIRNSNGYRIDVGARLDLTGVTFAEFYAGWLEQDYEAAQFGTLRGIDFGASVVWNFTTLDTLRITSTRTVNNANAEVVGIATSPGYLASVVSARIDHELLRNLLLNATASYENDDWKGIDRGDNIYGVGVGAKYLLNRNLYLGLSYTFQRRTSDGLQQTTPYSQNIFLLRLSTQI
jgi:hypothetical protein